MSRLLLAILVSCGLCTLVVPVLSAQETDNSSTPPSRDINNQARPIEGITVIGQQSLFRLRRRITEKEEEIFANLTSSGDWNALPWDLKVETWSLCYSMCLWFCWFRVLHIFFLRYLPPLFLPVLCL